MVTYSRSLSMGKIIFGLKRYFFKSIEKQTKGKRGVMLKSNNWLKYGLLVIVAALLGAGCDSSENGKMSGEEINTTLRSFGFRIYQEPVMVEEKLLEAIRIKGEEPAVRLVNFWATWCLPCRKELPSLQRMKDKMKGERFKVVTVSMDKNVKAADKFIQTKKLDFTVVKDVSHMIGQKFGVRQLPTAFLLNKNNEVLATLVGSIEWDEEKMVSFLKKLSRE